MKFYLCFVFSVSPLVNVKCLITKIFKTQQLKPLKNPLRETEKRGGEDTVSTEGTVLHFFIYTTVCIASAMKNFCMNILNIKASTG